MSNQAEYSRLQILLHWLVALLVAFNYFYSEGMGDALDARLDGTPAPVIDINPSIHVWVGVAVLSLTILRFANRLLQGVPKATGAGYLGLLAEWVHRLLYLLLFIVPVMGAVTWFGAIDATGEPHALIANILLTIAGLHAIAALFHQFVLKDGLILKMLRFGR